MEYLNDYLIYIGIALLGVIVIAFTIFKSSGLSLAGKKLKQVDTIELLTTSRDQFKKLFEEAPIPYFVLNNQGEIKDINKAALRFFHVTPNEILFKNLFSFAAPEDFDYAKYLLTYCLRNIPISDKEIRMISKSGEIRWVRLSVLVFNDSKDLNLTSLATISDITEEKNLDNAKTEFVSLASHQLRAPLATIKWYTEMIAKPTVGELNEKQKEYIKTISDVGLDMIELVDTLLNVSRIEIGKLSMMTESTNVQTITDSILTELSSQIQKKKMNVIKTYNGIFTDIKSDPKLLRIVIHNLISNSIKYTPDEGTISILFREDSGKNKIEVSDNGYGIPKNQQEKIFTKLFRADNVKEIGSSQSTGLGLYLVQSLIKTMGGNISFVSEENKGTTFTVTL